MHHRIIPRNQRKRCHKEDFLGGMQGEIEQHPPWRYSHVKIKTWHNGAAVDYQLVSCFNGFFIQVVVEVNNILMENIRLAAPLIIPQLHIDQMVLTDPQLLQVTAFVPGGDTLISSRSLTMTEKRNRVFTILDSGLRQRFADMRNVGFLLLTAHPSSKWTDPAFSPQKEKVVVVYSDDVLQGSASVLLRLSLPPHDAEGAIYVRRRLRLRLGISLLCGDAGAECLCYVNGMELSNDREMAVDDAAFIHCWGLRRGRLDHNRGLSLSAFNGCPHACQRVGTNFPM